MISVEDVRVDGLKAVGLKVELPGSPPLVLVIARRGFLMCGYMNRKTAGKLRTPVAVVTGVSTVEEALRTEVEWVNEAAEERGIRVGMTGTEAVKLMF